jgi:hypothetical protein
VEGEELGLPRLHGRLVLVHRRVVGAEPVAPVDERHRRCAVEELRRPVERGVAAADDHDFLTAEGFGIGHNVVNPAPVPRLGARLREAAR